MSEHALFSASGAHRWINCPGSLALEKDLPNISSSYAEEGTRAHEYAAAVLLKVRPELDESTSKEMKEYVGTYVNLIHELSTGASHAFIERKVDFSFYLDEAPQDAFGTADAIILRDDGELIVVDLKYGMGVRVDAEENEQLMLYALGAYGEFSLTHDITSIRLVISQPRLNHVSEWKTSVEPLEAFATRAKAAAATARVAQETAGYALEEFLKPSEDACRFCRAKHLCPALEKEVYCPVFENYDASQELTLGDKMGKVELIEQWCKAIREQARLELFAGRPVQGWRLGMGKRGNRAWADTHAALTAMQAMRLRKEEMYDYTLISPTTAEKRFAKENPRRWNKLQKLITQAEGKPAVVRANDRSPVYVPVVAVFEDETGSDLI